MGTGVCILNIKVAEFVGQLFQDNLDTGKTVFYAVDLLLTGYGSVHRNNDQDYFQ